MPEDFRFEHRDITPERRSEQGSPEAHKRTRAEFFAVLLGDALRNYEDAKRKTPGREQSAVGSIEFFFKKKWDTFTEPILEYEDLLAEILTKKWESNGAKSRALSELKIRRENSLESVALLVPDFENFDGKKRAKTLAKIYEGYAAFIAQNEKKLGKIAEEDAVHGSLYKLNLFLNTKSDQSMREDAMRRSQKKERRKARKAEKKEEGAGETF